MAKQKKPFEYPPWTPFEHSHYTPEDMATLESTGRGPIDSWINSRYQVDLEPFEHPVLGAVVKIGIKDHWRTTRHDWRDFQRIKNELLGPEVEALELYPKESRLVDTSNQYYMFALLNVEITLGWNQGRLISEGNVGKQKQRPFDPSARPADCVSALSIMARVIAKKEEHRAAVAHPDPAGDDRPAAGGPARPNDEKPT